MRVSLKEKYKWDKINHDVWMGLSNSESWTRHGFCENCGKSSYSTTRNILIWNTSSWWIRNCPHVLFYANALYDKTLPTKLESLGKAKQSVKVRCDICPVYFRLPSTWLQATSLISLSFNRFGARNALPWSSSASTVANV